VFFFYISGIVNPIINSVKFSFWMSVYNLPPHFVIALINFALLILEKCIHLYIMLVYGNLT